MNDYDFIILLCTRCGSAVTNQKYKNDSISVNFSISVDIIYTKLNKHPTSYVLEES